MGVPQKVRERRAPGGGVYPEAEPREGGWKEETTKWTGERETDRGLFGAIKSDVENGSEGVIPYIEPTRWEGQRVMLERLRCGGVFGAAGICGSGCLLVRSAVLGLAFTRAFDKAMDGTAFFSSWGEKQVSNGLADSSERFIRRQDRGGHLGVEQCDGEHQRIGEGLALFLCDLRFYC